MIFCILLSLSIVSAGTVTGNTFADIQNEINNPNNGGSVELNDVTHYTSSGSYISIQNTGPLTISGPSSSNRATLDANSASSIFIINATSTIIFKNIIFTNANSGVNPGGAILAHSTVIFEDCAFTNNQGQSGPGIIINTDAAGSRISNCEFINNQGLTEHPSWGWGEGAAIDTHADNTLIENCYFEDNYVKNNGGAISIAINTGTKVSNCKFVNNIADNNGGAILIRNSSNVIIEDCIFTSNKASYGSAIFNDENSMSTEIINCVFTDNFAKTYDIIAPDYIVNRPDVIVLEISLVLGDNILDAIYNQGGIIVDGSVPVELDSSPYQDINLTFEGITYTETTDVDGVATFNIPTIGLALMDYVYTVEYEETLLYGAISKTGKITVTEGAVSTGAVPGTGQNPITGPIIDIPTSYPPIPPYIPPTTITITITKSTKNVKVEKKSVKVEYKMKKMPEKTIKKITYCQNIKVNGKLKPYKITANQTYINGKKVGKPTIISKEKADKNIYFKNFDLSANEQKSLKKCLAKTANCAVNNSKIKNTICKILGGIKGPITSKTKASALQNWTQQNCRYKAYANTKLGSLNTLKKTLTTSKNTRVANCADQSHLMTAMLRTCGIPTVYEHGMPNSGSIGHYWPRSYIYEDYSSGEWVRLDTTNKIHSYDKTSWPSGYSVAKGKRLYSLGNFEKQVDVIKDKKLLNQLNKKKYTIKGALIK